jgi:hypothetical protein
MKGIIISLTLASAIIFTASQAQVPSITRLEKQHGPTRFEKRHLDQAEAQLIFDLDSTSTGNQTVVVQDIRYLEQLFPSHPFALFIEPLGRILRNKNSDPVARKLAALALDELHSEAGDAIINEIGNTSNDNDLTILCKALQIGDATWKKLSSKN